MSKPLGRIGLPVAAIALVGALHGMARGQLAGLPPIGEEYRPSTYPEHYGGEFYPAQEFRAVAFSRARVLAAQADLRRCQNGLTNAIEDLRRTYKQSPELNLALAEERTAYEALNAVRQQAIAELKKEPAYQAAVSLRQRLAEQVERRHEQANASMEELLALATVKLSYAATASAMEAAAISAEPRVREARQRLVEAGARLSELRAQFDATVRTSPAVLAARHAVEEARIMALAAEGFYLETEKNRTWVANYAYDLAFRPSPTVIYPPYYDTGYGGGYGGRYPIGYPYTWRSNPRRR